MLCFGNILMIMMVVFVEQSYKLLEQIGKTIDSSIQETIRFHNKETKTHNIILTNRKICQQLEVTKYHTLFILDMQTV